jgi:hypothetical protein
MNSFSRIAIQATAIAAVALALLCIAGAFMGAERAAAFFNSAPMAVFWALFAALLVGGAAAGERTYRRPGLLALHVGAALVLAGAFAGSRTVEGIAESLTGRHRVSSGRLIVAQGAADNVLYDETGVNAVGKLPFFVFLKDFTIERHARTARLLAREGRERAGKSTGAVESAAGASDTQGAALLPTLLANAEATEGLAQRDAQATAMPAAAVMPVRSYRSDVEVIDRTGVTARAAIEVNHPFHYRGYHIYQYAYGFAGDEPYAVLLVKADSGLTAVYAGFGLLCAGTFWWAWGGPAARVFRRRRAHVR